MRVHDIGVKVAALMTERLIRRRLPTPVEADRVILPGRCRGDLDALARHYGVAVRCAARRRSRPAGVSSAARAGRADLSRHDVRIFAEIVDAPSLSVDEILGRAR